MIHYVIEQFSSSGDLLATYSLHDIDLPELQRLFNIAPSNPMYDMYPIGTDQRSRLEVASGKRFDLDTYNYYVTAEEE